MFSLGDGRQWHKVDAIHKEWVYFRRNSDGELGFADAWWPNQGKQTPWCFQQTFADQRQILIPADQRQ